MLHGQFLNNYSSGADILIKDCKNKQTNKPNHNSWTILWYQWIALKDHVNVGRLRFTVYKNVCDGMWTPVSCSKTTSPVIMNYFLILMLSHPIKMQCNSKDADFCTYFSTPAFLFIIINLIFCCCCFCSIFQCYTNWLLTVILNSYMLNFCLEPFHRKRKGTTVTIIILIQTSKIILDIKWRDELAGVQFSYRSVRFFL